MPQDSTVFATTGVFPPNAVEFLRTAGATVAGFLVVAVLVLALIGLIYMPAGRPGFVHLPGTHWAVHAGQ